MVRIFLLALICLCVSTLKIYADCDLPTGGACSLEELKKEHQEFSEMLSKDSFFNQTDKDKAYEHEKLLNKDPSKQVDLYDMSKNHKN